VRHLVAVYNRLIVALAVLAGATIVLAFVLVIVDVGVRTAGFKPPAYTSAVVEYALLYFALLAAPYLVRRKSHVYIDALTSRLPGMARFVVEKLAYSVCIVTSLIFAYIGWELAAEAFAAGLFDERSIDIPYWLLYLPMPGSFALVAVEFARYLAGVDTMYADRTEVQDSV
jgi:TRAP-type C4-dicarboxylate transport system permease small subunit